jgi:integrase
VFTPPHEARKRGAPARVIRSTGITFQQPIALAKKRAAEILESFWSPDAGQATEALKLRSSFPTIGQLLDAYEPRASDCKPATKWANKVSLLKLLKDVFELESREKVEALRCDVLSEETAKKFLAIRERRALKAGGADNLVLFNRACITANATLRQARSVISPKLECYSHFKLPNFDGFRKVRFLNVGKSHTRYVSPGAAVFDAMDRDISQLRDSQPFVFAAYWFLRFLGLRPSELVNARWSWIDRTPAGHWVFKIQVRPDFEPKNGVPREIPISPEAVRLFNEIRGASMPTAYIINLPFLTDRRRLLKYDLNAWMRRYVSKAESEKCAYLLRKEAGSIYFHRYGIEAAAQFLGDTIQVAKAHYLADKPLEHGVTLNPLSFATAATAGVTAAAI